MALVNLLVSQFIPRITYAPSSGTTEHQTICAAPEANEILSFANLVLNTLNFFPNVMYIGCILMVVASLPAQVQHSQSFALCLSQLKPCCNIYIKPLQVIPKAATSSNGFHQIHKHPANANTKKSHVFLPTFHCIST